MVSKGVILQTHSGRKRKLTREDNFRCIQQRTPGEEDLNQMDQSAEESRDVEVLNQMSQSVEGAQAEKVLNQLDQCIESVDHMSQLPDHVIHRILSLLRNVNDAVRTSVLSKRWKSLWYSFSILIYDERKFVAAIGHEDSGNKEKMFRDHVSNTLQTHLEQNLYLQKLVLHMTSFDLETAAHIDQWLSVARGKNIKELDLHVGSKNHERYILPEAILTSTTMSGLRISRCKLVTGNNIMLPSLQKLYLRKLHLFEIIIEDLISGCPLIEDLRFIQCSGFNHLQISNHFGLNRVEIHSCSQLTKVEISAPNLHTFWYCGKKSMPCKISLEGCRSLKRLTLEHPQVTRDFCENQISNFRLLEKLDLSIPKKMKYLIISNPELQRIALKGYNKLSIVAINARNLLSLEYKGEKMPYFSINPFCLTGAKLSFEPTPKQKNSEYCDTSQFMLRTFIEQFDPEGFKLVLHSNKNIVIHEDLNNISLPPSSNLSLEIIKSTSCIEDILYSLLRTLHPESLSIISPSGSKFSELVYETIKNKDKDPVCCKYNTMNNKCWRHFLKDVKFEDLKVIESEGTKADKDKKTSTTLEFQMANLRLCWNSYPHGVEA